MDEMAERLRDQGHVDQGRRELRLWRMVRRQGSVVAYLEPCICEQGVEAWLVGRRTGGSRDLEDVGIEVAQQEYMAQPREVGTLLHELLHCKDLG